MSRLTSPAGEQAAKPPRPSKSNRDLGVRRFVPAVFAVVALVALGVAIVAAQSVRDERSGRKAAVQSLQGRLARAEQRLSTLQARAAALQAEDTRLANRIDASRFDTRDSRLASRVLRSVFIVETPTGFGTAWAAWRAGGATYLITANHVAQGAIARGTHQVTIGQRSRSWPGVITATDSVDDLAVIRVTNLAAPPLWQAPHAGHLPVPGEPILLVGSPYGLQGTVTTGVVSRVRADQILTDAAANPGSSGGPAVDADGHVVGVLLSAIGQELNFLVPIQRACVTVRACP